MSASILTVITGCKIWVKPNGLELKLAKTPLDKVQQVAVVKIQRLRDHIAFQVKTEEGDKLVFGHKHDLWIQ